MYRIPRVKVKLVHDGFLSTPIRKISDSSGVYEIVKPYIGNADREHFVVLAIDAHHQIINIHTAAIGTPTSCYALPREIFKPAILSNAVAIIIAHNHPSQRPKPTMNDITTSRRI